jgi:hypothetical protein
MSLGAAMRFSKRMPTGDREAREEEDMPLCPGLTTCRFGVQVPYNNLLRREMKTAGTTSDPRRTGWLIIVRRSDSWIRS